MTKHYQVTWKKNYFEDCTCYSEKEKNELVKTLLNDKYVTFVEVETCETEILKHGGLVLTDD